MTTDFHVIGIGSSAGGIDPLIKVIKGLPTNIQAAILVVQHIPNGVTSNLRSILSRATSLNVVAVEKSEPLQPGNIYVMALGRALVVEEDYVKLTDRSPDDKINRTVDTLFLSMAEHAKDKCIGIILSGGGFDGIEGAKAIEKYSGLVIVQDPGTAQFPLMPKSLIANDHPDYILTPEDISKKVAEHVAPAA